MKTRRKVFSKSSLQFCSADLNFGFGVGFPELNLLDFLLELRRHVLLRDLARSQLYPQGKGLIIDG